MRRILLMAGLAISLFSCKKDLPVQEEVTGKTKATVKTAGRLAPSQKIKLLKSWSVYARVYHGAYNKEKAFYAEVANIAYNKKVYVHHKMQNGSWQDFPLSYMKPADNGTEIWGWEVSFGGYNGPDYPFSNEYVLKYEVNGQTYWDNNNGRNYKVDQVYSSDGMFLQDGLNISADTYKSVFYSGNNQCTIYADLRNLSYQKNVTLVYTTDEWKTVRYAPLNFVQYYSTGNGSTLRNPNVFGIERWSATVTPESAVTKIQYAISYAVNGQTYWDNNFGRNYTINKK